VHTSAAIYGEYFVFKFSAMSFSFVFFVLQQKGMFLVSILLDIENIDICLPLN